MSSTISANQKMRKAESVAILQQTVGLRGASALLMRHKTHLGSDIRLVPAIKKYVEKHISTKLIVNQTAF